MNRPSTLAAAFLGVWCCAAAALAAAQQPEPAETNLSLTPADKNKVIYVSNFDLENLKADEGGIAGKGSIVPPPILPRPSLRRKHVDPDAEAKKLVDLMSNSLVSDLNKAGLRHGAFCRKTRVHLPGFWSAACLQNWMKEIKCGEH